MPKDFFLQLAGVEPFRTLDGVPNAIWTYSLDWSDVSSWRARIGLEASHDPGTRVALEFSDRINIREPGGFPDVQKIQTTKLEKPATGDVQYVYRDSQTPSASPVKFCFIAPAEKNSFTAVKLVHKLTAASSWSDLAFKSFVEGDVAFQQVMDGPAVVCPAAVGTSPSTALDNSARRIEKATLVPLIVAFTEDAARASGGAVVKFGFVRQLTLQPGEVKTVEDRARGDKSLGRLATGEFWNLLASFEGSPMASQLPSASAFSTVPMHALRMFGEAIREIRKTAVQESSRGSSPAAKTVHPRVGSGAPVQVPSADSGRQFYLLHVAAVAVQGFTFSSGQTPIGMLNLERIEMAPAGIQRGELIATIPLAPLEETAVIQKEWSVTTKEFTSIVTDSLETISETGVTDNTELAQSTTSQIQHGNQFNITGTVSGGIPLISGSVSSSFGAQDSTSQSAADSRKHAVTVTQKASSRAKQEHKVTISTTTVTGASETTTRTLKNSSATDPIRIDYFSMMRKWQVRLYRYGLRLTYDIVIPEPAGGLRKAYADLDRLRKETKPFDFRVTHSEIKPDNNHYLDLADQYEASVPSPPGPGVTLRPGGSVPGLSDGVHFFQLDFDVAPSYWVTSVTLDATVTQLPGKLNDFAVLGATFFEKQANKTFPSTLLISRKDGKNFMEHAVGRQTVTFFFNDANTAMVQLSIETEPLPQLIQQWQMDVWNALYNAAQTQYYSLQQDLVAQIAQLEDQLNNVDTLTLRREEGDEIMKGVLQFMLGYGFEFMPADVVLAITQSGADIGHGVGFTGNSLGLDPGQLAVVRNDEDRVRFINQAIEWENVVSFLYSYFWDVPTSWDFIRRIKHPDPTRQAFLRSGSARVVLTIRKGWEDRWVRFVDTGDPDGNTASPYLTIAQEIAAYDDRNYPGIPPANPAKGAIRLEDAIVTTSTASLSPSTSPVEIKVDSSAGFLVGAQVVIDSRVDTNTTDDFGKQESQIISAIRDGFITVLKLDHTHGGDGAIFPIVQPGERGVLIAEWNEYTPTSGTDIAVTSNLATIA